MSAPLSNQPSDAGEVNWSTGLDQGSKGNGVEKGKAAEVSRHLTGREIEVSGKDLKAIQATPGGGATAGDVMEARWRSMYGKEVEGKPWLSVVGNAIDAARGGKKERTYFAAIDLATNFLSHLPIKSITRDPKSGAFQIELERPFSNKKVNIPKSFTLQILQGKDGLLLKTTGIIVKAKVGPFTKEFDAPDCKIYYGKRDKNDSNWFVFPVKVGVGVGPLSYDVSVSDAVAFLHHSMTRGA